MRQGRIEWILIIMAFMSIPLVQSIKTVEAKDHFAILTIAYEASGESEIGQIAVANTIKTRMAKRNMTSEQVVMQKHQFSCWLNGEPTQTRKLSSRDIERASKAWDRSQVWEYDHYAHYQIENYWTRQSTKSERIGAHIFYAL